MKQTEQKAIWRRLLALLLAAVLAFGCLCPVYADEDGAPDEDSAAQAGTTAETVHIATQQDLHALALSCRLDTWSQGKTVVLDNDLALDEEAAEFLPIPSFGGVFDGGGHTISGLALTGGGAGTGLFDTIQQGGVVRDLTVVGQVTLSGGDTVGGIAGKNHGKILNCAFEGVVEGSVSVGGLVGINEATGQIVNGSFRGAVTGEHYVGGIAGQNAGSLVQCSNEGDINTTAVEVAADVSDISLLRTTESVPAGTDIGGVAGFSGGIIQGCRNSGAVGYEHMGYNVGGIVGRQSGFLDGCTNTGTIHGRKDVGGIAGQLEPQITLRYGEDMLDQLYTELDTLQGLTNQALADSQSVSGSLSANVNTLLGNISTAKDAVGGLSTAVTDWGNGNLNQINDAAARMAWVVGQSAEVVDQVTGIPATMETAAALVGQALETAPGNDGAGAEMQAARDDMALARTEAETCMACLREASDLASQVMDGSLDEGQIQGIQAQLAAADEAAGHAASALESAAAHIQTAVSLLGESGEPSEDTLAYLEQAADIVQSALASVGGAAGKAQSIAATLADQPAVSFTPVSSEVTNRGDTLDAALSQVISSASGLQSSLAASSDALIQDFRAINNQVSVITDLVNRNVEEARAQDDPDVVEDVSDTDTGDSTMGRLTGSVNNGAVYGDLNVAGIAGSMSVEYDFDPEDDLTEDGTRSLDFEYETLALVTGCTNQGEVSAKKDYVGGIVGRMDLGAVKNCESYGSVESTGGDYVGGIAGLSRATIRGCYVKCFLSGGDYIGGVVGAGQDETVVTDCATLVQITDGDRYTGAVSGTETGSFSGNVYVSDTLAGLGRISYAGQAEPVSFSELSRREGLPQAMTQFTLRFVVEDEEIQSQTFGYGDSFGAEVFPEIPVKEGCYAAWDTDALNDLHFDTTVTAQYTRYVLALPGEAERSSGRAVFLADGEFDADAVLTVTAADTPEAVHGKTPLEQWHVCVSDTEQTVYTLRYLAPDEDPESVRVYVRQDGAWRQADCEVFGSYLVFALPGAEADVAVLAAPNPVLRAVGIALAVLAVLTAAAAVLVRVLRARAVRRPAPRPADDTTSRKLHTDRARAGAAPAAETPEEPGLPETRPEEKTRPARPLNKKRLLGVLVLAAALLLALGLWLAVSLRNMADAYAILQDFAAQPQYALTLSTDTQLDDTLVHADFTLYKTREQDRDVTCVYKDGMSLYYTADAILMENGKAYALSDLYPDYTLLPLEAARLYQTVDFSTSRQGDTLCYTLTAEGENARTILGMLLPGQGEYLTDTHKLTVELTAADGALQTLRFASEGTLVDEDNTPYSITAELQPAALPEGYALPEAVAGALADGLPDRQDVLPEDLFRLLCAWTERSRQTECTADLTLGVDCGPLTLDETLKYQQAFVEDTKIGCVRSGNLAVYFADGQFCGADGTALNEAQAGLARRIDLLEVLHQICLNGTFTCVDTGNATWLYTLTLDEDAMRQVALAAAPELEDQPVALTEGSVQILVKGNSIADIRCECTGGLAGLEEAVPVTVSVGLTYTEDGGWDIPAAVQNQLTGKEETENEP